MTRGGGNDGHAERKGVALAQFVHRRSDHADSVLTGLLCRTAAKNRAHGNGGTARGWFGAVVLALLLFCEVTSAMVGAEAVFFSTIVAAWLVLPFVVGLRNVLDAGCFYMLISLGIVVVAGVAS
jgi:hypothetical protein